MGLTRVVAAVLITTKLPHTSVSEFDQRTLLSLFFYSLRFLPVSWRFPTGSKIVTMDEESGINRQAASLPTPKLPVELISTTPHRY